MRIPILTEISPGGWGGFDLNELDKMLAMMSDDDKAIELYVASPGGDVAEADKIYSRLLEKKKDGYNVTAILAGEVASAASYIIMAAESIQAYGHARIMIHNAWTWAEGNQHDLDETLNHLKAIDDSMAAIYSAKTGLGKDEILDLMKNTTWMSAEDAKSKGFIDSVIEVPVRKMDAKAIAARWRKPDEPQIDSNQLNIFMSTVKTEIGKFLASLGLKPSPKAMIDITLEDGNTLRVDTDTEDILEKTATLVDSEGNESVPTDGTHTDSNGRVITTEGGVITSVEEPTDASAALNAKIAALEAENAEYKAAIDELKNAVVALKKATPAGPKPAATRTMGAPKASVQATAAQSGQKTFSIKELAAKTMGRSVAEIEEMQNLKGTKK